jgi:membrane-associated phospholipid phosphatase
MPPRLLALVLLAAGPASAQDAGADTLPPDTEPADVRLFRAVYDVEAWPFAVAMRVTNGSAYPVFVGAAPALLAGAALDGTSARPALRLALAEAGTVALTFALKGAVRRPRPYAALDDVVARDRGHVGEAFDPFSFPSGHTSTAFVIATSLGLSYPEWYVVGPAALWAGGMGLARVWHGVHYPTDVLAGAVLGTGAAVLAHVLLPDEDPEGEASVVPLRLVVPL